MLCCWEVVWQQDVIACEPRSEVPAGKPWPNVAPKEQAGETKCFGCCQCWIFVYGLLRPVGWRNPVWGILPGFCSNSFFQSVENTSEQWPPGHLPALSWGLWQLCEHLLPPSNVLMRLCERLEIQLLKTLRSLSGEVCFALMGEHAASLSPLKAYCSLAWSKSAASRQGWYHFIFPFGYVDRSLCKLLLKTSLGFGTVSVHMYCWIQ